MRLCTDASSPFTRSSTASPPRPGDAIAAVALCTAYAACPALGYQETHSPGGRRSAPDPTPVALRICANGITPDERARLRPPRVLCRR